MHSSSASARGTVAIEQPSSFLMAKIRREQTRWLSLIGLNRARPESMTEVALLAIVQAMFIDATNQDLRRELDYLKMRELLSITDRSGIWNLKLTYQGIDVVEYTTPCPEGIGRPKTAEDGK